LIESVEHHIDAEEREWFPQVRAALGRKRLQEIGRELLRAQEDAPTRSPHLIPARSPRSSRLSWSNRTSGQVRRPLCSRGASLTKTGSRGAVRRMSRDVRTVEVACVTSVAVPTRSESGYGTLDVFEPSAPWRPPRARAECWSIQRAGQLSLDPPMSGGLSRQGR
jgi:hypothetical protein